jgi:hypothetical protein
VLRYECYREGMVPDREVVYTVTANPKPGEFTFRVTPGGDRTVTWEVDESANELLQKFSLPDPETGELTRPGQRLLLKLPGPDAVVDGDYMEKGLRVHSHRVDLSPPPGHPRGESVGEPGEAFTACLRVESWEEGRAHYHYFKEGKGLVGVEVFERRPAPHAPETEGQGRPTDPAPGRPTDPAPGRPTDPAPGGTQPPAAAKANASGAPSNGKALQPVLVYARYLVEG